MERLQKWPVFICYRRVDGASAARRLHDILVAHRTQAPDGSEIELDPYLDQDMPGVSDWRRLHRPYLEKARALLVICTPGVKLEEGEHDWVHHEIDWWLANREEAPILIDPLMEGIRFVPRQIVARWPDIQRIPLIESEWARLAGSALEQKTDALRRQVIGAVLPSGAAIYEEELEHERARVRELEQARDLESAAKRRARRLFGIAVGMLFVTGAAGGAAFWSAGEANRNATIGKARQLDAEAGQQFQTLREMVARRAALLERRMDLAEQLDERRVPPASASEAVEHVPKDPETAEPESGVAERASADGVESGPEPAETIAPDPAQEAFRLSNLRAELAALDSEIDMLSNGALTARKSAEGHLAESDELWEAIRAKGWKAVDTRSRPAPPLVFSVEVLAAGVGESILIHYGPLEAPRLILINTGPGNRYAASLGARFRELSRRTHRGKPVPLELLAIGDQDYNKSQGLLELLREIATVDVAARPARIELLWANIFRFHGGNGGGLRNRLREQIDASGIPFNQPFGRFVFRPVKGSLGHRFEGGMNVMVLGPTRRELEGLYKETKKIAIAGGGTMEPFPKGEPRSVPPLFRLGSPVTAAPRQSRCVPSARAREKAGGAYTDRSVPNLASTVLLFQYAGRTFLHTGDSRGDLILEGLSASGLLDAQGRAYVDLMNIPHQGSDRNVTGDFFARVRAGQYLITGDGHFNNPAVETLASLIAARQCETFNMVFTTREYRGQQLRPGQNPPESMDAFFADEEVNHPNYTREFLSPRRGSIFVDLLPDRLP